MKQNDFAIVFAGVLIGYARSVGDNMPNVEGMFEPTREFDSVSSLFEKEYSLIKGPSQEWLAIKEDMFRQGLELHHISSATVIRAVPGEMPGPNYKGILAYLHIHGGKVWWRLM